MFLWPLQRFWTYTPHGWLLAVVWNLGELFHVSLGNWAPHMFGIIIDAKGEIK